MNENQNRTILEFDAPRLVRVRFQGLVDLAEARRIYDFMESKVKDQPYFLNEYIIAGLEGATPEGRGHAAERLKLLPQRAIAIIGGTFAQRTLGKLVLTASIMLDGSSKANVGSTFKTEEEAREWLRAYAAERDAELAQR